MNQPAHTSSAFEKDLADLNMGLVRLGMLASRQLNACLRAMSDFQENRVQMMIEQDAELDALEDFGIVSSRSTAGVTTYGEDEVEVGRIARDLLASGVEARHLRGWKTSAEREVALFEQLVAARARLRNPEARREMGDRLSELEHLGGRLRSAMVSAAIRSRL